METREKKTIAERISAQFYDDGNISRLENGRHITHVCGDYCGLKNYNFVRQTDGLMKYVFEDGSSIVYSDNSGTWDLGINDSLECFCWQGVGHSEDCPHHE